MQRGVGAVVKVQRSCPLGHILVRPSRHFPRPTRREGRLRDLDSAKNRIAVPGCELRNTLLARTQTYSFSSEELVWVALRGHDSDRTLSQNKLAADLRG